MTTSVMIEIAVIVLFYYLIDRYNKKWDKERKVPEHKCNFTIPYKQSGISFKHCDHKGCNMIEPTDNF
jgi:hypothetical protein